MKALSQNMSQQVLTCTGMGEGKSATRRHRALCARLSVRVID